MIITKVIQTNGETINESELKVRLNSTNIMHQLIIYLAYMKRENTEMGVPKMFWPELKIPRGLFVLLLHKTNFQGD